MRWQRISTRIGPASLQFPRFRAFGTGVKPLSDGGAGSTDPGWYLGARVGCTDEYKTTPTMRSDCHDDPRRREPTHPVGIGKVRQS